MPLSPTERATLAAVCRTLIPDSTDWLPTTLEEVLATSDNQGDLAELGQALTLLESPAALLLDGRRGRFSQLPVDQREAVLRRWASHPLPLVRKAFQAIKRLASFLWYSGTANGLWAQIGYAGRDERPAAQPALRVSSLQDLAPSATPGGEITLAADAVVIGSGAGGGVAAARLAERGLKVLVLEKGGFFPEATLGMPEAEGMQQLYLDRGMLASRDLGVAVLAGSAVGGGTLVNWSACLTPPDWLRQEWEQEYGLTGLTSSAFQACVDEVVERLHVHSDCSTGPPGGSADRLLAGCRQLGYAAKELPRNASDCGEDCGFCIFGCRSGGKQSTARTYLVDAVAHGAHVLPRADVRRVLVQSGRVAGVQATVTGQSVTIRAPRVVLAAGAIGSPAVLLRSGLTNPNIGRHLHLHPVLAVSGVYPGGVGPWHGRLLSAYSNQFARVDGNYGFLLEVAPVHPGQGAMFMPWQSGEKYQQDLLGLNRTGVFIVLARDKGSGRVTVDRAGRHQIDYRIAAYDQRHLLQGQAEAIRVHAAAGAERIITVHAQPNILDEATPAKADAFAQASFRLPSGPNQLTYFSAHQMGTCRMGRSPRESVADARGEVFGVRGLYVADGSAFPAASGVNPMLTILSLARWVAKQID